MELVTGLGIFIVSVLTAALSRTIVNEFVAWSPWVIRGFIKLAVAQLPNKQRERFDEEWQSHVSEVPGIVGKLIVAAGLLFAARKMAMTDRRGMVVARLWQKVGQIDALEDIAIFVRNSIRNDKTLSGLERLRCEVKLNSLISKHHELRKEIYAFIAAVSDGEQHSSNNLRWLWCANRMRRLSRETVATTSIDNGIDEILTMGNVQTAKVHGGLTDHD